MTGKCNVMASHLNSQRNIFIYRQNRQRAMHKDYYVKIGLRTLSVECRVQMQVSGRDFDTTLGYW